MNHSQGRGGYMSDKKEMGTRKVTGNRSQNVQSRLSGWYSLVFGYGDFGPWESQCISVLNLPFFDDPFFLNGVHANFNTQFCQLLMAFSRSRRSILYSSLWTLLLHLNEVSMKWLKTPVQSSHYLKFPTASYNSPKVMFRYRSRGISLWYRKAFGIIFFKIWLHFAVNGTYLEKIGMGKVPASPPRPVMNPCYKPIYIVGSTTY